MQLSHRFTVPTSLESAWATFQDLERITPCFPGASLTTYNGDSFTGACKVKVGPVSLQYTGSGRFLERDESAYRAVIEAKGSDKRGNGTAAAVVTAALRATSPDVTEVAITTDLTITGRPAQFGRGVMQDVSDRLLAQFTACIERELSEDGSAVADEPQADASDDARPSALEAPESTPEGEPVAVLDLGAAVLPAVLKRYGPWLAGGFAVALVVKRLASRR